MILPYSRTNKAGNKEQFWTHSSFIPTEQFAKVEQQYNTRCTYRNYISLFAGLAGLKLGSLDLVRKVIPAKVPLPGVAAIFAVVGYALGHVVFVQGFPESQVKYLLNHNTIPLWKQKKNVVNLHRAFFHLDDSNHNKPDLLYHGLTGESAAKIFPDAISGPLPKAPEFHGHGHGHGHDGHGHEEKAHH